jgi:HPt (histidine-containing phosphotransfer) domain-containing protein
VERPIDLDNLRKITDGDAEMEAELFQIFLDSSAACMQKLRAATAMESAEIWYTQTHAMKGICFNLGAGPLGQLCKDAQESSKATAEEKLTMLTTMEKELQRVKDALTERASGKN